MEVKAIMDTTLGRQVSERVNGKQKQLGNAKLLEEFEVDAASIDEDAKRLRAEGRTAMGTGTDVAMESARVTLVKGDLRGIVRARLLSKATMRNIRTCSSPSFTTPLACPPPPARSIPSSGCCCFLP